MVGKKVERPAKSDRINLDIIHTKPIENKSKVMGLKKSSAKMSQQTMAQAAMHYKP